MCLKSFRFYKGFTEWVGREWSIWVVFVFDAKYVHAHCGMFSDSFISFRSW